MRYRQLLATVTVTSVVVMLGCPAAQAITPPEVDPAAVPPSGAAGSVQAMGQRSPCVTSGVLPGSDPAVVSSDQAMLDLSAARRYSTGAGQLVAVLDTGVKPGPRLPNVDPGGDFVEATDGLVDCDGHGTLVAGLIAGQPGDDGFAGVAPEARVLSIRATSPRYSPRTDPGDDPGTARTVIEIANLARAVVRAADLGARVITVSEVTCVSATADIDQAELGAALRYAAVDKDAVIVAAAGNNRTGLNAGSDCPSNAMQDFGNPDDPRNWAGVTSLSVPSWWQPYVLSVGSIGPDGQASSFTTAGPWVGIAAPGENVVSVGNGEGGGLVNGLPNDRGELFPLSSSSFAAGYVAGVAALVRSRFPDLSAKQVVERLTASAQGASRDPSNLIGAGPVDPVAALTWDVSQALDRTEVEPLPVAAPAAPAEDDPAPKLIAFVGTGVLALAAIVTAAVAAHRRKDSTS